MGRKFDFEFVPLTLEQLRGLNEDDLYTNLNKFKRLIREAKKAGKNALPFETEFCYLEHERIMRSRFSKSSNRHHSRKNWRR